MGVNAQTTVPTFVTSQVLTAAQMNQSARTGVPVFANTTDRDAAFGGTGEKTLAEGQLCYVENLTGVAQIQYYDGASWVSLGSGGLAFISSTTIGTTVSTVTVSNAFSSTYDNYYITIAGGVASGLCSLRLSLGAVATGYYGGSINVNFATGAVTGAGDNNAAQFSYVGWATTNAMSAQILLNSPNLAKLTNIWAGPYITGTTAGTYQGEENGVTQHTAFTITPSAGTLTGGSIRVYGLVNS